MAFLLLVFDRHSEVLRKTPPPGAGGIGVRGQQFRALLLNVSPPEDTFSDVGGRGEGKNA